MGLTTALPVFLILRAVGGVASAFVLVFASTVVLQRLAQLGRGELSAVHFAGVGSAIVISALAISAVALAGYGWSLMWVASGALSFAALLAVLALLPPDDPGAPKAAAPLPDETIGRGLPTLLLAYGLFGFGYVVTATFIVAIVKTYPAAHPVQPFVWLLVGAAAVPSVMLWTLIGGRIGVRRAFAVACVVEALGVAVSVLRPTADGAVIARAAPTWASRRWASWRRGRWSRTIPAGRSGG